MIKLVLAAALVGAIWLLLRKPGRTPPMPEAEARAVLGVDEHAGEEAIRAAWSPRSIPTGADRTSWPGGSTPRATCC